jgi:protein-disulfide isomerase
MNKGTAIVGFFLCFLAGMGLMYGIDRKQGVEIAAEPSSDSTAGTGSAGDALIPVTAEDPQWGKSDALVTIVEISDFQCPFCSRVGPTLKQVKDTYGPDKVRIVWKHQPLPFHKEARPAHEAAATVHAIAGSDAFWKFHDSAFANQRELNDANFEKWAAEAGADLNKFREAYKAKKYAAKVDADMALAQKIGATGTPAFRINGVTLVGAQPFEQFKTVIDAQLKEAEALVASGTKKGDVYAALVKKNFQAPEAQPQKPQQQQGAQEDESAVWKVPVFDDDPVKGPKDALVTIVEWSDFQCPFCTRVEPTIKQVMDTYKNDVRVVWKDNALPFHKRAKPAANLARFAYKQKGDKGFWDAHEKLFANQSNLEDDGLEKISGELGLPWAQVKQAIDSDKFGDKINASMDLASEVNARGTPHFFVNGRRLSGAQPFEKFKALVDEELGKAKALVAKGTPRAKVYDEIMKNAKGPPPPEKKDVPPPGPNNAWKGGKNAKVVIQEFSDFQCPFCKRVEPTMDEILKEYGDKVKIVWRHLPLDFHQDAPLASEAAQEAFAQKGSDGFWAMHKKIFDNQQAIKRPDLEKYAQELGLDMAKFKQALDTHKHKAVIDADKQIATNAGVRGTPGFTINGYFLSGAQPINAFQKLINLALKEAR